MKEQRTFLPKISENRPYSGWKAVEVNLVDKKEKTRVRDESDWEKSKGVPHR